MDEWEPVNSSVTYVGPATAKHPERMKKGDFIEGIYADKSIDPKFSTTRHELRAKDGARLIISGGGQLNSVLKNIAFGTKIRIEYDGKKTLESGQWKGTEANQWKVMKAKVQQKNEWTREDGNVLVDAIRAEREKIEEASKDSDEDDDFPPL